MTTEIMMNKANLFKTELEEIIYKNAGHKRTVDALSEINVSSSLTLSALKEKETALIEFSYGYTLGLLKVWYDTLPNELADSAKINDIPVNYLIKLKVDEKVLALLETMSDKKYLFDNYINSKDYQKTYKYFCEMICGYGYNLYFLEHRFAELFPGLMKDFVSGFAKGYSKGLETIAKESGIEYKRATLPVEQDIWKNWEFFFKHDCEEYSLAGKYQFMYHGGCGPEDMPYGSNIKLVNEGIYEKLKSRPTENFASAPFEFNF